MTGWTRRHLGLDRRDRPPSRCSAPRCRVPIGVWMATRHRRTTLLIAMLVAACETTPLPSASQIAVELPEGSSAPSQLATAAPPTAPPAHRIGIRVVDGRGEFFDRGTGEQFVPRGANYLHSRARRERDRRRPALRRLRSLGRRGRPAGDARPWLHGRTNRAGHLPGRLHRRRRRRPPRRLPPEHRGLPAQGIRGRPAGPHPGERPSRSRAATSRGSRQPPASSTAT